jgi:hypothetical protein
LRRGEKRELSFDVYLVEGFVRSEALYIGASSRRRGQCFSLLGINAKQQGPFGRFSLFLPHPSFKSTFLSLRSCSMVLAGLEIIK